MIDSERSNEISGMTLVVWRAEAESTTYMRKLTNLVFHKRAIRMRLYYDHTFSC